MTSFGWQTRAREEDGQANTRPDEEGHRPAADLAQSAGSFPLLSFAARVIANQELINSRKHS